MRMYRLGILPAWQNSDVRHRREFGVPWVHGIPEFPWVGADNLVEVGTMILPQRFHHLGHAEKRLGGIEILWPSILRNNADLDGFGDRGFLAEVPGVVLIVNIN